MKLDLDTLDAVLRRAQTVREANRTAAVAKKAAKRRKSGRYGIACKIAAREPLACGFNPSNTEPVAKHGGKRWFRKQ